MLPKTKDINRGFLIGRLIATIGHYRKLPSFHYAADICDKPYKIAPQLNPIGLPEVGELQVMDIVNQLSHDAFNKTLSLEEKGAYWIGYHKQRAFYGRQKENEDAGKQIKAAREAAGLSRDDLAEKFDLCGFHIELLEQGLYFPTAEVLEAINSTLGTAIVL